MSRDREEWAGAVLGGRHRVGELLGTGGVGAVYEAVQEDLGRRVAIKVLHESLADDQRLLARLEREAKTTASLGHPNIIQVTDFQNRPGEPAFLVMDLLAGHTMGKAIRKEGHLPQKRVAFIAQQVLSALAAAHDGGIIHRDLKPDNVFLTSVAGVQDIVKLLDFGIAKLIRHMDSEVMLTKKGYSPGTPAYMSPEQIIGLGVDGRTDLYSLGVVMYRALTGKLPFSGDSNAAIVMAISRHVYAPMTRYRGDLDEDLAALVDRAMAKDPDDRFADARQMRGALDPWAEAGLRKMLTRATGFEEEDHARTVIGDPAGETETIHGLTGQVNQDRLTEALPVPQDGHGDPTAQDHAEPRFQEQVTVLDPVVSMDGAVTEFVSEEELTGGEATSGITPSMVLDVSADNAEPTGAAPAATSVQHQAGALSKGRVAALVGLVMALAVGGIVAHGALQGRGQQPTAAASAQEPGAATGAPIPREPAREVVNPPGTRPRRPQPTRATAPAASETPAPASSPASSRETTKSRIIPAPVPAARSARATRTTRASGRRKPSKNARPAPPRRSVAAPVMPGRLRIGLVNGAGESVWAEVRVDGQKRGGTPLLVKGLMPGSHVVELRPRGQKKINRKVVIKAGVTTPLVIELKE